MWLDRKYRIQQPVAHAEGSFRTVIIIYNHGERTWCDIVDDKWWWKRYCLQWWWRCSLFTHTMHQKLFAQTFYPQKTIYTILQKDFYAKPLAHKKLFYTHLCFRRTCFTQRSKNIQTFHEILTHRAVLYMKVMKVTLYIFLRASAFTHKTFLHRRFCSGAFTCKCLCTPMLLHKKM